MTVPHGSFCANSKADSLEMGLKYLLSSKRLQDISYFNFTCIVVSKLLKRPTDTLILQYGGSTSIPRVFSDMLK